MFFISPSPSIFVQCESNCSGPFLFYFNIIVVCMHAMETQGVQLLLLLLLCAVSTCWGQGNLVDKLGILGVISQFTAIGDTYMSFV